jgi:hypothetical protein
LRNDSDDDDDDDDEDDNNNYNNNTPAKLFCKSKQICAFHTNFAAGTQHGGSSWSAEPHTVGQPPHHAEPHTALSPSAFYVTGKGFNQNM